MTQSKRPQPNPLDINQAIRDRILGRVKGINWDLLTRLQTAADDLNQGHHLAALGALDGIEREIATIRSYLSLLSEQGTSPFTTQPSTRKEAL
jgi:hypothetical protein